jgi:hypothetical protein
VTRISLDVARQVSRILKPLKNTSVVPNPIERKLTRADQK